MERRRVNRVMTWELRLEVEAVVGPKRYGFGPSELGNDRRRMHEWRVTDHHSAKG